MKDFKSIKEWATEDRPREKLQEKGSEALSNSELLAILINTGMQNKSALDIAKEILNVANHDLLSLSKFSLQDFRKIKGMGIQKAVILAAALELGKRRQISAAAEKIVMRKSQDIFENLLPHFYETKVEQFYVMYLTQAMTIQAIEPISLGGMTSTVVDVRVIFKRAFELQGVTKIAIAHNHPSGSLIPSEADKKITNKIIEASNLLDFQLVDHLIIANNNYFSFADDGLLGY
jgi:DNA repair protein RadC